MIISWMFRSSPSWYLSRRMLKKLTVPLSVESFFWTEVVLITSAGNCWLARISSALFTSLGSPESCIFLICFSVSL